MDAGRRMWIRKSGFFVFPFLCRSRDRHCASPRLPGLLYVSHSGMVRWPELFWGFLFMLWFYYFIIYLGLIYKIVGFIRASPHMCIIILFFIAPPFLMPLPLLYLIRFLPFIPLLPSYCWYSVNFFISHSLKISFLHPYDLRSSFMTYKYTYKHIHIKSRFCSICPPRSGLFCLT